MSTRLLQRLSRRVLGFRPPVPCRRLHLRGGAMGHQQAAFHHFPVLYQGRPPPPSVGGVRDEYRAEETACDCLLTEPVSGTDPEDVHPGIWQGILHRDVEKLRDAIAAIPDNERQPTLWLHLAIEAGNEAAAALFMKAGADMLQMDYYLTGIAAAPYRAIHKHRMDLARKMWKFVTEKDIPDPRRGSGGIRRNMWLAVAAECGHADMVEDMLGWSNTDWDYDCALSSAAYNWHYETIKALASGHTYSQAAIQDALSHACDLDREIDFEIECCCKCTPARRRELADVIRWLVDAGAMPDNTKSASTGTRIVALFHDHPEHSEALSALLEKGATNVKYERIEGQDVSQLVPVRSS